MSWQSATKSSCSQAPNNIRRVHGIEFPPMFGRFKITALALTVTITVFAAKKSSAQTAVDPGSHSGKTASSDASAGRKQPPESLIKDPKASGNLDNPELFGPVQQSDTSFASSPVSDSELEKYIANTLKKDPTLSGTNVRVAVSDDQIKLSGNVANAKEKLTAGRIAQSFGGNKKLVNQITIGEPATSQTPNGSRTPPQDNPQNHRATPAMTAQPSGAEPPPLR